MAKKIEELLQGNKNWVKKMNAEFPDFFEQLSQGQSPQFLWIGCSDSRVPSSQITDALPGSIFVHRNIANMVVHTDLNLLSVINYAVKVLKVKHIIVCGHYGCGGVRAAMSNQHFGFLDNWLAYIKDVYRHNKFELDAITDPEKKEERYVELNVCEQVTNLSMISFIQEEWQTGEYPYIHGWVYGVKDGLIKDLGITQNSAKNLDDIFKLDINQ